MWRNLLTVIGIGPGSRDYLVPEAIKLVQEAEILIGGKRALALFSEHPGTKMEITGKLKKVMDFIHANQEKKIAVLVSGDPGFHSLLPLLKKNFPQKKIKVIPGISSVQLAFARLALPWHDAVLLSLHGRKLEILTQHFKAKTIAILTDPENAPPKIAEYWLKHGGTDCQAYICKNLSYENEEIECYSMSQLAQLKENTPCVMVIINERE